MALMASTLCRTISSSGKSSSISPMMSARLRRSGRLCVTSPFHQGLANVLQLVLQFSRRLAELGSSCCWISSSVAQLGRPYFCRSAVCRASNFCSSRGGVRTDLVGLSEVRLSPSVYNRQRFAHFSYILRYPADREPIIHPPSGSLETRPILALNKENVPVRSPN